MIRIRILIRLRPGVLDPQGEAVCSSLHALGFKGVSDLRIGRCIELNLDTNSEAEAKKEAEKMCSALLANPVIESYEVEVLPCVAE